MGWRPPSETSLYRIHVVVVNFVGEEQQDTQLTAAEQRLLHLMAEAKTKPPVDRPSIQAFKKTMIMIRGSYASSIMSYFLARITAYTSNLEASVIDRTQQLIHERRTCDVLLSEMLPR